MPDLTHEMALGGPVAGVDEAGRGPLAGPVLAAAVILPPAFPPALLARLDDSKKLSARRRAELSGLIRAHAHWAVAQASVAEIDRLNILNATFLAMERAVDALAPAPRHVLVDGNRLPPGLTGRATTLVGGDGLSASIAAASILAKEARDAIMRDLAQAHPGYGWERNAGYGTAAHMEGLRRLGPTPHHRASFAPVAQLSLV